MDISFHSIYIESRAHDMLNTNAVVPVFLFFLSLAALITCEDSRLLLTHAGQSWSESAEKYYIYPLPQKFWWRWPDINSNCTSHGQISNDHAQYSGMCYNLCISD